MSSTLTYTKNGTGAGATYTPQANSVGVCLVIPDNGNTYTVQTNCASLTNMINIAHDYDTGTEHQLAINNVTGITSNTSFGANGSDCIGPGINTTTAQSFVSMSISSFAGDYCGSPQIRRGGVWPNHQKTRWRIRRSGVWVPTYFKIRRSGNWIGI